MEGRKGSDRKQKNKQTVDEEEEEKKGNEDRHKRYR